MATASAARSTDTLDHKRLLRVLSDYRSGDFSVRMPADRTGLAGKICDALNDCIQRNQRLASELERLSHVVGKAGNIKQRASLPNAEGDWVTAIESVNMLVSDLVQPTTEVARVIGAVAKGDLSQSMALEIDGRPLTGEFLRTAMVVNTMVEQLGTFASEVTRVAREVGTEGKLGGQAVVKGVGGTWKDLTDNVNFMAANLTSQVRNIADVTTAVANGDLSKKITVDVKGEIQELKNTINTMVDQLSSFASEVTRVAKEVGTEGKLGARPRSRASPARGAISRTTSISWPATSPCNSATSQRWRPRSPAATSRRRSRWTRAARFCKSKKSSTRWSISSARSRRK